MSEGFYGAPIAVVHHEGHGWAARAASSALLADLAAAGLDSGRIVELGCGTGISCRVLTDAGYDVVGVDLSPAMLAQARSHAPAATFVEGSVWDADLPAGLVAVTAVGEVLNYAADPRVGLGQLGALARKVAAALVPGGVFLCDTAGPGRAGPGGEVVRRYEQDGVDVITHSVESPEGDTMDRWITMYHRRPDDAWDRSAEHHTLVLHDPAAVAATVAAAGFTVRQAASYTADDGFPAPPPGWTITTATRPR